LLNGIDVHAHKDGQVYLANEYDLSQDIMSGLEHERGHKESHTKSFRVKEKWNQKRETQQPIGGRVPGWLSYDKDAKQFVRNEERVRVVQRIFKESASGIGNVTIMRRLNAENIPPFTDSDHAQFKEQDRLHCCHGEGVNHVSGSDSMSLKSSWVACGKLAGCAIRSPIALGCREGSREQSSHY
jgi:hypothetical protein